MWVRRGSTYLIPGIYQVSGIIFNTRYIRAVVRHVHSRNDTRSILIASIGCSIVDLMGKRDRLYLCNMCSTGCYYPTGILTSGHVLLAVDMGAVKGVPIEQRHPYHILEWTDTHVPGMYVCMARP